MLLNFASAYFKWENSCCKRSHSLHTTFDHSIIYELNAKATLWNCEISSAVVAEPLSLHTKSSVIWTSCSIGRHQLVLAEEAEQHQEWAVRRSWGSRFTKATEPKSPAVAVPCTWPRRRSWLMVVHGQERTTSRPPASAGSLWFVWWSISMRWGWLELGSLERVWIRPLGIFGQVNSQRPQKSELIHLPRYFQNENSSSFLFFSRKWEFF